MQSDRRAIEQRPLPFNLSVVSDFMRSRDKYWKDRVGAAHVTFAQICRRFESEVTSAFPSAQAAESVTSW